MRDGLLANPLGGNPVSFIQPCHSPGRQRTAFDRLYDNFSRTIDGDAAGSARRSADRYAAWVRGDLDELT